MSQSLTQRVDQVRRAARRSVWLYAWGWTLTFVLAAALLASLVDYVLRPTDSISRWLLTLSVVAAMAWSVRRWLAPAWQFRPSLLETSQRIEQHAPQLHGRLSSSMEFLGQSENDPTAGSATLRRRVIAETEALVASSDFSAAVNRRPQRQALAVLGIAALVLILLAVLSPSTVALGAGRLAMPWANYAWPRHHHLEFVDAPERIARGEDLEFAVIDAQQRLPDSVQLEIVFDDGERLRQEMKPLDRRMVYRVENVSRGFRYRAYGGDDDTMAWQRLEVVEPLAVMNLQVTVHPPDYAGTPWNAEGGVLSTLEGSRLYVAGSVDQPLSSAQIIREGTTETVQLDIATNGQGFELSQNSGRTWQPLKSGPYLLQLTSADGVRTDEAFRWDIRLIPDSPPALALESPVDGAFATPNAALVVSGTAKDDLAIASIELKFLRPGTSDEQAESIQLWTTKSNPLKTAGKKPQVTGGQIQSFQGEWDLQTIVGLQPGHVLTWFVAASDFRPQVGQSPAAWLTLISADEMQERLSQRQATALSQLAEALNRQRETRMQVATLAVQWNQVGSWRPRDRDLLHSAELHQRQVHSLVGFDSTGAATILESIIADIEANRLDLPDMASQCAEIVAILKELNARQLPNASSYLANLLRSARNEQPPKAETTATLTQLASQQEEIASQLETLLGRLGQWDSFQRVRRDLAQIREDQRQLMASTQTLQVELLSNGAANPQQRADAEQLAGQQNELVRRFEKLVQRLAEFASEPNAEPGVSSQAKAVADAAGKLAVVAKMRDSSRSAAEMKLGQAVQLQQQVDAALAELLDLLAGRTEADTEKTLQQLRDLTSRLEALEREQRAIAEKLEQDQSTDQQVEQQRELEKKTAELADQLQQQKADSPAESTQKAGQSMQKSAASAGKKNSKEAAAHARDAEAKLKEARQKANEEIANREADLLREEMARFEQHIQGLIVRQQAILRETDRLFALQESEKGELSEAQKSSIVALSAEQEGLSIDARGLAEKSRLPGAFSLQLGWAADDMNSASSQLGQRNITSDVRAKQESALDRLIMIAEALKPVEPQASNDADQKPSGNDPPPPPQDNQGPPPDIHDLAEVKLLRAMQAEINRRTAELEARRQPDGSLPKNVEEQLSALADEQGRVAELALKLVQSLSSRKATKHDDSSERPPEVSDEELLRKLDEALLP